MHKIAVLAICLLFASTVLQGATKHSKKSSASKHSQSSSSKSGTKKAASKGSGRTRSATARKTSRSKTRASARRSSKSEDEGEVRQTATRKGKGRGRTRRASASARSNYQRTPTPDRYREIQQALADRGFYQGPVNGEWGADSTDALKRYQQQQNLTPTGKLDSLSLISLGLGPKREPKAAPVNTSTNSSSTTTSQKEPLQP